MAALADFHEPTRRLRDRARRLRNLLGRTQNVWRGSVVAMTMSLFVAASGAFETGHISPGLRYALLATIGLALSLIGLAVAHGVDRMPALRPRPWLRRASTLLANLIVATLFCWGLGRLLEGARTPGVLRFTGPVAIFMATAEAVGWASRRLEARKIPQSAAGGVFSQRLPHALRGVPILAIHGEDHYVRVHTLKGEHLIWMRLGDAVDELTGLNGRQTHRSWWVSKAAVVAIRRGNGRAMLTLSNGLQAPVSRRFAGALREEGWY